MKAKVLSLSLSVAALAAASAPGLAGEWSAAGIADYNRSVAVPAPIPVPVNEAQWYVRADFGVAANSSGTLDVSGYPVETVDFGSDRPFSYSFGIGRYFDHTNLRWDVAIDFRDFHRVTGHSDPVTETVQTEGTFDFGLGVVPALENRTYNGNFYHRGEALATTALASLYYDLETGTPFTPYLGGGVGLAIHTLRADSDSDLGCSGLVVTDLTGGSVQPSVACSESISTSTNTTTRGYGVAASATAGFTYEVYKGVKIDTAYRFLYEGGNVVVDANGPIGVTHIDIGDRIDHEIRTGVRFDIF